MEEYKKHKIMKYFSKGSTCEPYSTSKMESIIPFVMNISLYEYLQSTKILMYWGIVPKINEIFEDKGNETTEVENLRIMASNER